MIEELQKVANNQTWLLDEFVNLANNLLPKFFSNKNNDKISDEVNARLVRHFATQRMLDEPGKVGRNAVYTYRHLLQLLVIRTLLSQGISAAAIGDLAVQKTNSELESILSGKVQLNFIPASIDISWHQIKIAQGLELNIRSDFNFNTTTEEQILAKIVQELKQAKQRIQGNQLMIDNMIDEALNKKVQEMFDNFKAFFNHLVSKERQQEWEESKEGWYYHALEHMTYWVLRDHHQLNDAEAKAEITNKTKEQLKERLLKIAPELAVTVQQIFNEFTNIFGHQVSEDKQKEWRQSADGWERMTLRHMLYWLFRKRQLEHEEAWLLTDKPVPQLKKRLLELAPELYQKSEGEAEQMIDWHNIKWTKNINHQDGDRWCAEFDIGVGFELTWKKTSIANAKKPEKGDLIILRQRARVTHIVEVRDDNVSYYEEDLGRINSDFPVYRWVKVLWRSPNFENAPHQDQVFGFDLNLQGGNAIDLDNIAGIKENFDTLEVFQKHLIKVLGL